MVILLVLLTFALCISITALVRARKAVEQPPSLRPASRGVRLESGERLFHPGHGWIVVNDPATVTVGVDNFAQQFIGRLARIELPSINAAYRQGDPFLTLHHRGKQLTLVAPVSGRVVEINRSLIERPGSVNSSPYEEGWVAKLAPSNLALELRNLMRGITASVWREALKLQLIEWFAPKVGPILQDGGQLVENFSELVSEEDWRRLVRDFFPVVSEHEHSSTQRT